jgi:hypothetical protein
LNNAAITCKAWKAPQRDTPLLLTKQGGLLRQDFNAISLYKTSLAFLSFGQLLKRTGFMPFYIENHSHEYQWTEGYISSYNPEANSATFTRYTSNTPHPVTFVTGPYDNVEFSRYSHAIAKQHPYPAVWREKKDGSVGYVFAAAAREKQANQQYLYLENPIGITRSGLYYLQMT